MSTKKKIKLKKNTMENDRYLMTVAFKNIKKVIIRFVILKILKDVMVKREMLYEQTNKLSVKNLK